jgi:hypothetical protein
VGVSKKISRPFQRPAPGACVAMWRTSGHVATIARATHTSASADAGLSRPNLTRLVYDTRVAVSVAGSSSR